MFWDDLGTHVKTRMTGRAGNLIYRKDIFLDFEFDASGRLLSYSKKEYLTSPLSAAWMVSSVAFSRDRQPPHPYKSKDAAPRLTSAP